MTKRIVYALCVLFIFTEIGPAIAQRVVFQDGVTELSPGVFYDGTEDTEFRSADPGLVVPQGAEENISVDGFDNGNVTQGVIRFTKLLQSEGGLLPDGIADGSVPIRKAFLTLYKNSPSDDGIIEFHRVIGPDTTSGSPWNEQNDAWIDLVDVLIPDPSGNIQEFPMKGSFVDRGDGITTFFGDGVEVATNPDFDDFQRTESRRLTSTAETNVTYGALRDSEDILDDLQNFVDANGIEFNIDVAYRAYQASFFDFDVTDSVTDWLANGAFNGGWVINNNSTDGWDFASADTAGTDDGQSFLDGETVIIGAPSTVVEEAANEEESRDPAFLVPVPGYPGFASGYVENSILLDRVYTRPQLTIIYGSLLADLNFDGVADPTDIQLFLDSYGKEIDGALALADPADLDFDRDVDADDFVLFKQSYLDYLASNSGAASGGTMLGLSRIASTVPEPSTGSLAAITLFGFAARAFMRSRSRKGRG